MPTEREISSRSSRRTSRKPLDLKLTEQSEPAVVSESVAESDGVRELAEKMDCALYHVRQLAKLHQEAMVHSICELHLESNDGAEPSTAELIGIYSAKLSRALPSTRTTRTNLTMIRKTTFSMTALHQHRLRIRDRV